jgi:hypothetical protein
VQDALGRAVSSRGAPVMGPGGERRLKRGGEGIGDFLFGVVGFTPSPCHSHDPGTP